VQTVIQDVPAWPSGPWGPALPSIPWPQLPQVVPTPASPAAPTLSVPTAGSIVAAVDSILADAGLGPQTGRLRLALPPRRRLPRGVTPDAAPSVVLGPEPAQVQATTALSPPHAAAVRPHARSVQPHASAAPASTHGRAPQRAPHDPDPRGPGDGMGAVESGAGLGGLLLPTIAALLGACLLLPPPRFPPP